MSQSNTITTYFLLRPDAWTNVCTYSEVRISEMSNVCIDKNTHFRLCILSNHIFA